MTATIFGESMGFPAFFGLPISPLCLPVGSEATGSAAWGTAISLAAPTALANAKPFVAQAAIYNYQFWHPGLKIVGRWDNVAVIPDFRF